MRLLERFADDGTALVKPNLISELALVITHLDDRSFTRYHHKSHGTGSECSGGLLWGSKRGQWHIARRTIVVRAW